MMFSNSIHLPPNHMQGVLVGGERVNEGDEGKGIWLMGFIYIHEI
jgi:hypothetical protein